MTWFFGFFVQTLYRKADVGQFGLDILFCAEFLQTRMSAFLLSRLKPELAILRGELP